MKQELFWKNPHYKPFPYLHGNADCDYLIVGGGVAGVSLAYFLAQAGEKKVILVEKNTIASGATGHAAGSLVASAEVDVSQIARKHGAEKAAAHWKMLGNTLRQIETLIQKEKIKCEFEREDTLYGGLTPSQEKQLEVEFKYLKMIDPRTKIIHGNELRKKLNSPMFTRSIFSPAQGISVNPLQLTQGLAHAAKRKGATIYEHTPVERVKKNEAQTPHGTITFQKIIWAIDAAHPDKNVENNKTTIVITRPLTKKELARTRLKRKKIIWDAKDYYGYAKVTKDNRLLVGLGDVRVHKLYNRKDPHFPHLVRARAWLKELFPYLNVELEYAWSATYGVTHNHHLLLEQKGNSFAIAGAGSQVLCVAAARELVNKLLKKPHRMDLVYL